MTQGAPAPQPVSISPEAAEARAVIFRTALDRSLSHKVDDNALLLALAKLHMETGSRLAATSVFTQAACARGLCGPSTGFPRVAEPKLAEFLSFLARSEAFLIQDSIVEEAGERILSGSFRSGLDTQRDPEFCAVALARSPWARDIGLLLNQTHPKAAALWPCVCALSTSDPELIEDCSRSAPEGVALHTRDMMLVMGCETRDEALLDFSLNLSCPDEPLPSTRARLRSSLESHRVHAAARAFIGMDAVKGGAFPDRPMSSARMREKLLAPLPPLPLSRALVIEKLLARFPSPVLASDLLASACKAELCLPENLYAYEWGKTRAMMKTHGAHELSLDGLLELAHDANLKRQQCDLAKISAHNPNEKHIEGGREFSSDDLDALSAACLKKALAPRSVALDPLHPPLAYRLLETLPESGPRARALILSAMDHWSSKGFTREEMAWRRSASGQTQSIGSAVANLPQRKDSDQNFAVEIQRWLKALAGQGFDFEAKSSPKSKSLGDRLRSSAHLKAFWPLVEARMIASRVPEASRAKRSSSL